MMDETSRRNNQIAKGGGAETGHLTAEEQSAYLSSDLSASERTRLSTHLASCAACEREIAQLRSTIALLGSLPSHRPRRSFQLTEDQVRTSTPWWERLGFRLMPALPALRTATVAAALLLVAVSVGDILWDRSGTTPVVREAAPDATVAPPTTATNAAAATESAGQAQTGARTSATATGTAETETTSDSSFNQAAPAETPTAGSDAEADDEISDAAPAEADAVQESTEPTAAAVGEEVSDSDLGADAGAAAEPATSGRTEESETEESDAAASGAGGGDGASEPPQSDTAAEADAGDDNAEGLSVMAAEESSPAPDEKSTTAADSTATPTATASPQSVVAASPAASPTAAEAPEQTASVSDDRTVWRVLQLVFGIGFVVSAFTLLFLNRLRRHI